jgi:competence protein ComEA
MVVIDVQGQVHRPGVVELPEGSRVVDALAAAGGVTRRATTLTLNLAQVLVDGTQVLVPSRRRVTAGAASGATSAQPAEPGSMAGGVVNLNTATLAQLDDLPGIGPVLAQRILDYRSEHGSFTTADQLMDVSGIGASTFADLESLVGV